MQFYYMGSLYNHYCNQDIELVNLNNNRVALSFSMKKKKKILLQNEQIAIWNMRAMIEH